MLKMTHKTIAFLKFLLFIILFCFIQIILYLYSQNISIENEIYQNIMNIETSNSGTEEPQEIYLWQIEIPKIGLIAPIAEGTTQEILNQYVGHFVKTSKTTGNIGLAAHNRGYDVNYFEKLKQLKEGDEILYQYNQYEKIYVIIDNIIIKDTEWEHLEYTEENQLTLITCVENEPEYRRCVKAIEKEEENN